MKIRDLLTYLSSFPLENEVAIQDADTGKLLHVFTGPSEWAPEHRPGRSEGVEIPDNITVLHGIYTEVVLE